MSKITSKITFPIILVGLFSLAVFMALNYNQLGPSFYVILLFLSIYIFSFGFAIGQSVSSPIKELLKKAREVSGGNLSSRVYLETKDELAELADILNKIAEELQENHIDEEIIEKTTEMKTKARTEALNETIMALEQKIRNRTNDLEKITGETKRLQDQVKEKEKEIEQFKKEINLLASKDKKPKITRRKKETISE
jgi:methyl-accepting chemotaxis protein